MNLKLSFVQSSIATTHRFSWLSTLQSQLSYNHKSHGVATSVAPTTTPSMKKSLKWIGKLLWAVILTTCFLHSTNSLWQLWQGMSDYPIWFSTALIYMIEQKNEYHNKFKRTVDPEAGQNFQESRLSPTWGHTWKNSGVSLSHWSARIRTLAPCS